MRGCVGVKKLNVSEHTSVKWNQEKPIITGGGGGGGKMGFAHYVYDS
jgi:hypothetical protein